MDEPKVMVYPKNIGMKIKEDLTCKCLIPKSKGVS